MGKLEKKDLWGVLVLIIILIGNALFLKFNAFRYFNFMDMGAFLDASWRVFCGQRPYIDFIFFEGPVHLYMNAFFFSLFGFGKTAVLAHLITIHSIVIILVYFMLRSRVPLFQTLLATLLTAPSFYWSISHPWHDQSAHFWGILGVALFLWQMPLQKKNAFFVGIMSAVLAVVSILTKPNLGMGYGFIFLTALFICPLRWDALKGFLVGSLLGAFLGFLIIGSPKECFEQFSIHANTVGPDRIGRMLGPKNWFINYYWIPLLLVGIAGYSQIKRQKELFVLFFGVSFAGILSANTGGLIYPANNFLWGVQVALGFIVLFRIKGSLEDPLKKKLWLFCQRTLIIVAVALTVLSVYYGYKLKAWTYALSDPRGKYEFQSEPFQGWMFMEPEGAPLDSIVGFIKENVSYEESLLNLSDMYVIYGLTGRESYRGVPFVFIEGVIPAPGKQTEQVRRNILADPPDWIIINVLDLDFLFKQLRLEDFLSNEYQIAAKSIFYMILRRKK